MEDFDLRKYLAEGKLLKEDKSLDGLKKAKPGTTVTVGKDKYVKKAENNMTANQPTKHLWWQKNKEDKLVHSNELAKLMEGKLLKENIDIAISKWGDIIMGGSYAEIPTGPVSQDIAELLDPVNDMGWSPEDFDDLMDIITHLKSNQSYINTTGEVSETWTYSPKGALGSIIVNFN